jgi:uncharacterized protein YifE (UPF0438 family)
MRDFSVFDSYLSEEGQQFLDRWGIKLIGLYDGTRAPESESEKYFVKVFKKGEEPISKSEIFWFNIVAIDQLIRKCALLESSIQNELSVKKGLILRINNQEREIMKRVHPLEEEVSRLKKDLYGCWAKIDRYERELGIEKPVAGSKPGDTCPVCKGTGGMGNCSRCDGKGYI